MISKIDYSTEVIEALQGAYRQDWCLTNWTGTGKPLLPAGMIISILGFPYIVTLGDEEPTDPAADGAVFLKITPDAPAGATATAVYTNSFSGSWLESYNGFYDGNSLFLNIFMTKSGANWTAKGTWLNFREKKLALISEDLTIGDLSAADISAVNGTFSGDVEAVNADFSGDVSAVNETLSGSLGAVNGVFSGDISRAGIPVEINTTSNSSQSISSSTTLGAMNLGQVLNVSWSFTASEYVKAPTAAGRLYEVITQDGFRYLENPNDTILTAFATQSGTFSIKRIK